MIVETPVKLTGAQKEVLRQFQTSLGDNSKHSPRSKSWFDGVKKFFDDMTAG